MIISGKSPPIFILIVLRFGVLCGTIITWKDIYVWILGIKGLALPFQTPLTVILCPCKPIIEKT
jgi:hypothetical protein